MNRLHYSSAVGVCVALFILVGRWDLSRLSIFESVEFLQPRYIVTGIAAILVAAAGRVMRGRSLSQLLLPSMAAAFFAYMCFTLLWTPVPAESYEKAVELAFTGVMVVVVSQFNDNPGATRLLHAFWSTVLFATGALAVASLLQLGSSERLSALGGGPNVFARMMGLLALSSVYLWRTSGRALASAIILVGALSLTILSGSRGGLLAVGFALLVVFVFWRPHVRRALRLLTTVALATCLFSMTPLSGRIQDAIQSRLVATTFSEAGLESQFGIYTSGRDSLYASAFELALDHPYFGAGLNAFEALGHGGYPHNLFLELACEGGIAALLLFLLLLLTTLTHTIQHARRASPELLGGLALTLAAAQFSGDLFDSRGIFLFIALMNTAACNRKEQTAPDGRASPCALKTSEPPVAFSRQPTT